MQRTIEVSHEGHTVTDADVAKAARAVFKAEGLNVSDFTPRVVEITSGGPSKFVIEFTEDAPKAKK